jgi:hypothetical protein
MWNILHIHTECELYSAKDCQSCRTLIVMEWSRVDLFEV